MVSLTATTGKDVLHIVQAGWFRDSSYNFNFIPKFEEDSMEMTK